MPQHFFNSDSPATGSDKAVLDAMFTELYSLFNLTSQFGGNLGFYGVPTLTAGSGWNSVQLAGVNWSSNGPNNFLLGTNMGGTVTSPTYAVAAQAALYQQVLGQHQWKTAPVGSVGGAISFTLVMSLDTGGNLTPGTDNTQKLGGASNRWSTVYAGTGTINTSDAREKTAVTTLSDAEIAAAQDLVSNIGIYQWLSSVQAKGAGDARKHVGMTVQQAITVMTAHGLDPMAYGFICYDSWPQQKDEQGNVILEAGDRYSFRPDELGMFIARGVAASIAAIDARLTALEAH